jgi:uncharacterized membrane protein
MAESRSIRSFRERILMTLALEAGGLIVIVPLFAALTFESQADSAILILAVSATVMVWSPIHNFTWDRAELRRAGRLASDRPHHLRVVHAVSHEVTSALLTIPVILILTDYTFAGALITDLGLTVFYTFWVWLFNLAWDGWRPVQV